MRPAVPFPAVLLAVTGVATLRPGEETGACAQGAAVAPRADCDGQSAAGTSLVRRKGRFAVRKDLYRRTSCATLFAQRR